MARASRPRSEEVAALGAAFWDAVMLDDRGRMLPCWFCEHGFPCGAEGRREAAHFIKRQEVERWVRQQPSPGSLSAGDVEQLVHLAAWDPRNAVPAHESGHRRFDGHRVPLPKDQIVVPIKMAPVHVVEFCADWGLEAQLERRCSA